MSNKKITISSIDVVSFRNLKNQHFDLNGNNAAFSGCNALGKTNLLNAIMWCLTGADLFDNCSDSINVPHDYDPLAGCPSVDVTVTLNVGTIRRWYDGAGHIDVNDSECTSLKLGETMIDSMLGTLELSVLNKSKKFNVRKFLLNPLYIKTVTPIDFRKFVLSLIGGYVNVDTIFDDLPSVAQLALKPYNTHDVESISTQIKANEKKYKKAKDDAGVVHCWLSKVHPEMKDDLDALVDIINVNDYKLGNLASDSVALDKYAIALSSAYNSFCKSYFNGISFVLLEKGNGDDVYKDVCYPLIPGSNVPFDRGSTSEQIRLGCMFVLSVISHYSMTSVLPLLFDECETLDFRSLNLLSKQNDTQLITACVVPNLDHIERRDF